ncbi:YciI family protein [Marinomonas mediterranea]|uniref:YCII-related protein n=1 Tax=Marinomonas mediterranea (strain ATCC 700492 / JCM 21426 / NBRC 103028 / MMB-1) TaxID=717774 RepID=F2K4N8_MARM1|nr:YciI family protein [Marinomonas mediterranea]ADZ91431.1 YCII-related protein [Marinomonas mediterranea MMB-1]WCN09398.1 hypothetical protein GV055_10895 [Marinomonas mediterranea]WCN17541.1 hypothetical protein GV053_11010 [Marinomonas mediterranea MMB-1]
MSNYMLIYLGGDPEWAAKTTPEEMAAAMQAWTQWMENLQSKDQLVSGGDPLNYGGKRVTAEGVVTDIAAAEFKELVSGYSIVKANNYDEAVEITKTCPIFSHPGCTVEVREIMEMNV